MHTAKLMDLANSSYNLRIYGNYFFNFFCFIFPPSSDYNICHIQGKLKYKKSLFSVEQKTSTNLPEWKCKSFLVSWEHWPYYIYILLVEKEGKGSGFFQLWMGYLMKGYIIGTCESLEPFQLATLCLFEIHVPWI